MNMQLELPIGDIEAKAPAAAQKEERQLQRLKCELYHDSFQNFKKYQVPKAQLVIADVPYNVGANMYGSNPVWYKGGSNKNGESKLAGKAAFYSDYNFNLYEYFHFCNRLLKKEPTGKSIRGRSSEAPCMIVFCSFEQIPTLKAAAAKHGFIHSIPLVFIKNSSPQALKANMRIVGATEYALVLYRDRLPKFRNGARYDENGRAIPGTGRMVLNWMEWKTDNRREIPKIHPTQKPQSVLRRLIEVFTDPGDVVIDPVAGSGSTLRAAHDLGRNAYGFECYKDFVEQAREKMLNFDRRNDAKDSTDEVSGVCI